ncbi:large ribosomal subunit protein bL35 [Candidatus Nesciobacter abundans]|uniref:50S ribosomal protein L35 n=1 Tax=Candidatus Nesciobacter abundans TaxID=2601668 RepID=A0A5C0UGU4_9PROT|nr:50S ribosomal protein L35 [Candidatus Nesciobacter abundans]QEK39029.1 50S ribosomal protein L35 [Candidatus Nesciobacter abundans]
MKLKTKKSAWKRLRTNANGKILRGNACKRHGLRKRRNEMKKQTRGLTEVHSSHAKLIKKIMPNGLPT